MVENRALATLGEGSANQPAVPMMKSTVSLLSNLANVPLLITYMSAYRVTPPYRRYQSYRIVALRQMSSGRCIRSRRDSKEVVGTR